MSEEASWRVQDEHDRMFPLRAGRSFYPKLSTVSSCKDFGVGTVAFTLGTNGPNQAGRGGSGRGGSTKLVEVAVGVQEAEAVPRLARYRVVFVLRLGYLQSHSRKQMHHQT